MSGDDHFHNISVPFGTLIRDILGSENIKKTDPGSNLDTPCSGEQKQDAPCNDAPSHPEAVILNPKKRAHYKMISGPEGDYLYSERCVPVQVAINNPKPGFELSVTVKNKALTHQCQAVQACLEHCNIPPAESKGMDLRTPDKAAFALMAGGPRSVQYELEDLHPTARVPLDADAGRDVVNLVFPCYSSCKPHKICGNLMLLHLNIRDINTRKIVSSSELTVRVAANVLARASQKYEEDMLGKITPRRPAKRRMLGQGGEGLDEIAEVLDIVAKHSKRDHGNERKDDASGEVDVMDPELDEEGEERDNTSEVNHHDEGRDDTPDVVDVMDPELNEEGEERDNTSEVNHHGEGWDDTPDVVDMADHLNDDSCDRFAKEAVKRMLADIQAKAAASTLASDDTSNMMNGTGSASNQFTLVEDSYSTNQSVVNIGATSGISLDSIAGTDRLPNQMVNNQASMVPMANNSALTFVNQNQAPPEGCSLTSSTLLDSSNNPPVSWQKYAVSADVGFVVTGLRNPDNDCPKIQQHIESLGATCSQVPVVTIIRDDV